MLLIDEIAGLNTRKVGYATTLKMTITMRELLHIRVQLEWDAWNDKAGTPLVKDMSDGRSLEARLNRGTERGVRGFLANDACATSELCLEPMFASAEQAFCDQRIFVLLDEQQAESLEQVIEVECTSAATFLLLTPLQGG